MKDKDLAKSIVSLVGGVDNVKSLVHCVTRLRFKLKDESIADTDAIKDLDGVMTVVKSGGQYQVVIGDKVDDIYNQVMPLLCNISTTESTDDDDKDTSFWNKAVALLSSLFMPVLGVLAASGVLKGLLALCTATGWLTAKSGTYMILYAASDAIFYFLPIILGFAAGNTFKTNPYLTAVIGGALVYPSMVSAYTAKTSLTFLGAPVILMNYVQTLIPIIAAAWLLSLVSKLLKAKLPKSLQMIFVPLLSLVIVVPATFLVVGPITSMLSTWLADAVLWVYGIAPVVAGFVLAGIWQLAVLLGLHWAFIPIFLNNIATKGYDPIDAMLFCTVFGQVGAALALTIKAKDPKFKELAASATLSGILGITEPIIYGVTITHKKSFVMASIGSAFGGAIAGFSSAKMYGGFAPGGIFGIPMFMGKNGFDSSFIGFLISLVVAFGVAFALSMVFGEVVKPKPVIAKKLNVAVKASEVGSPLVGQTMPLSAVKDEVFSTGMMGKGLAILPTTGEVHAPFDGQVVSVFPTKHAIGLKSNTGIELLIHLGLDTVNLKGEHFDTQVKVNDIVKAGDLLETFDIKAIEADGYDMTVPIIVTNTKEFNSIKTVSLGNNVNFGDEILSTTVSETGNEKSESLQQA
ncbi:beta-glucoside-specific PTS transporter subunit IIABC [Lactiplantibacillus nangangensis]|uniref:Beta-glucoside-specific PTS transporter subunit IIABC n=1 Tax=Lactiplantibacillus nangangensis TaxID=2559917 RepID=A0ABW1SH73_9LACO|nr:beta-glucoside-specific PTS transporter subunit IIABC [Lactiplantibacillus nangangensis]